MCDAFGARKMARGGCECGDTGCVYAGETCGGDLELLELLVQLLNLLLRFGQFCLSWMLMLLLMTNAQMTNSGES